jgi:Bacterial Ig-like domain
VKRLDFDSRQCLVAGDLNNIWLSLRRVIVLLVSMPLFMLSSVIHAQAMAAAITTPSCTPTEPRLDNSGTFVAINDLKRLEVQGGRIGTAGWEWALGTNTQTAGKYASANLDWVSARSLDWTLSYDGKGGATVIVKNGTSQVVSLSYSATPDGMITGNALKFSAATTADAGTAKINATVTSINGQGVTGSFATAGNSTASTSSLVYYFPALKTSSVSKGTIKFTFTGSAPPQDARMDFTVTAGNLTCGTTADTTKPMITTPIPAVNAVVGTKPSISAQYTDTGTGIDTTKVSLLVDNVNVTVKATITATGISYVPSTALTAGSHAVALSVSDKAGNIQTLNWSFTADALAPTISAQAPSGTTTNNAKPVITAQYADQAGASGIDTSKSSLACECRQCDSAIYRHSNRPELYTDHCA